MPDRLGDQVRLRHAIDAISEIENYTKGLSFEKFVENSMVQDACIRQLGILGEACNRMTKNLQDNNQQIDWKAIIGLRNIVIHQYFGIDIQIV